MLSGGLSGAKVVRMHVTDSGGARVHHAVAKLGSLEDIQDEAMRFDNQVSRLDLRATPRKLANLNFGGGALAGVFYGLARISQCAPTARITSGGEYHPDSCRFPLVDAFQHARDRFDSKLLERRRVWSSPRRESAGLSSEASVDYIRASLRRKVCGDLGTVQSPARQQGLNVVIASRLASGAKRLRA
jgi:hypothetical protein